MSKSRLSQSGKVATLALSIFSMLTINPKTLAQNYCSYFQTYDKYQGVNTWGILEILKINQTSPCSFFGDDNRENQYFSHLTYGKFQTRNGEQLVWNIKTVRVNRSNGCVTEMRGTMILNTSNPNNLYFNYTSTDGRCDLPTNFTSSVHLQKL